MAIGTEWLNRLLHFGRRTRFEDDLGDEIRFHLETRVRDLEAAGLSTDVSLLRSKLEHAGLATMSISNSAKPG